MKRIFYRFISVLLFAGFTVSPAFGFGGGGSVPATGSSEPIIAGKMSALTILVRQEDTNEILEVPLFSEKYAELPVATVNSEPITLKKFAAELAQMHAGMTGSETPETQSLTKMLDRLITIRLVKQEALNIGFDRTPAVQQQIENFALKTMIKQLLAKQIGGIKVTDAESEEIYQQMAIEAKMLTYSFSEKAEAESVLAESQAGATFKELADKMVANGKAQRTEETDYVRLTELFPAVALAVSSMENGSVSEIFQSQKGYLVFQLEDKRIYEDPEVRLAAASRLLQQKSQQAQLDYLNTLTEKFATFDEEVAASFDFVKIAAENPKITGEEVFSRLNTDMRPLVTMTDGQQTIVLTVAEISKSVEGTLYHGNSKVIDGPALNGQKETVIRNKLVAITGKMEAQAQGIDQSVDFIEKVQDFETEVLFDTFVAKAVVPGIKVPEQDAKEYYLRHMEEEYASPLMLKMKSLPFADDKAARKALKQLQDGSDFKWVSANSTGLADVKNKDILNFGDVLLSETALPEDLRKTVQGAKQGDIFYYADPKDLYYILVVDSTFPPKVKPYEEVREDIGRIIYAEKINDALNEWVAKLKEVYETKVFLVENKL
ncbi:MAG: peptidyl-prolyl cis-trans isomerase [Desulfuromonadales bacterium]|nr:peptidyl-prolyl cis-trans isomerase [Desulfuromonadales bacterium]